MTLATRGWVLLLCAPFSSGGIFNGPISLYFFIFILNMYLCKAPRYRQKKIIIMDTHPPALRERGGTRIVPPVSHSSSGRGRLPTAGRSAAPLQGDTDRRGRSQPWGSHVSPSLSRQSCTGLNRGPMRSERDGPGGSAAPCPPLSPPSPGAPGGFRGLGSGGKINTTPPLKCYSSRRSQGAGMWPRRRLRRMPQIFQR